MMAKEEIYDSQISPLVKQIIAICKEYDIPALLNFDLGFDESDDYGRELQCTTAIFPEDTPETFKKALAEFNKEPEFFTTISIVTNDSE